MLNQDFRDILSELSTAKAEFLLVGAYAMAFHGAPRATGDLDIWIRPDPANADRVLQALRQFGAPMEGIQKEDLSREDWVIQLGVVPRRIDLITSISGVSFGEAWAARTNAVIEGLTIPVIDLQSLIRNKRSTGRPKDKVDIEALERTKKKQA